MAKSKFETAKREFATATAKSLAGKLEAKPKFVELLPFIIGIIEAIAKFCREKTPAKLAAKINLAKTPKKGAKLQAQLRAKVLIEAEDQDKDYSDADIDAICAALIEQAAGPQKANVALLNAGE